MKDAAEVAERPLIHLKESLLRGMRVGPMKGGATSHRTHLEDLKPRALPAQHRLGFIPVTCASTPHSKFYYIGDARRQRWFLAAGHSTRLC